MIFSKSGKVDNAPGRDSNATLRILNCLHRSHLGGAQRRVVWVSNRLQQEGIETVVLFPEDQESEYEDFLRKQGHRYVRLRFAYLRHWRKILTNIWFLLTLPWVVWHIVKVIRGEQIDVVHVNGVTNLQPVFAALLCGKPVVWHLNDMLTPKIFVRMVSPLFLNHMIRVVVATPAIVDYYNVERLSGSGWRRLPAPFFPSTHHNQRHEEIRRNLGLNENDRILGFVGNLVPLKGVLDFIAAAETLMSREEELQAVIVGGEFHSQSGFSRKVKSKVTSSPFKERFHLVGYQADIPAWLKMFDVLIFPSYSEACPIVVLEAIHVGLPIVATRVGDLPFIFENTNTPLVEPGDVSGLVSGAARMMQLSSEEKDVLGKQLKQRIDKDYALQNISGQHKSIYEDAVKNAILLKKTASFGGSSG